jgi:hypothetical protein
MLYSPAYLRAVVEEYLILRNGGDQIDPGLAARREQIATPSTRLASGLRERDARWKTRSLKEAEAPWN